MLSPFPAMHVTFGALKPVFVLFSKKPGLIMFISTGTGRSKKSAKNRAARRVPQQDLYISIEKMLRIGQDEASDEENADESDDEVDEDLQQYLSPSYNSRGKTLY